MSKQGQQQDGAYTLLGEVKKCPYTGKLYDAVRKVKCTCTCHTPGVVMMHFAPCCTDGYNDEYRYLPKSEHP